ncbi:MAG: SYNERG-CTERM sorting domain-containing protein [Synergistaceae bacterium]|nr:SYNERG-CTERM sorting domain-containing protein [Synergistaceae bacterium]
MKRTLRVLFLAVLAMTLMASVAFAKNFSADVKFNGTAKTVEITIQAGGSENVEITIEPVSKCKTVKFVLDTVSSDVTFEPVSPLTTRSMDKCFSADVKVKVATTAKAGKAIITVKAQSGDNGVVISSGDQTIVVTVTAAETKVASPDIESISVDSDEVTVAVDGTATVTATIKISGDNSYRLTSSDITVTPEDENIVKVTNIGTPESADGGKTFTVEITVTGLAAGSTDVTVAVNNSKEFKDTTATGTFKAIVTEDDSGSTSTFRWSDTEDLQEADVVLYVDSKGEVVVSKDFAVTLKVPSDYDPSTVTFVVLDEDGEEYAFDNWEVTDDGGSKTDSTDIYEYVLTFTPSASQDKASYTMYAEVEDDDGNTVSTDKIAFTVAVLVSTDATTEDTTYTLKMEEPEVSATELKQGEKATVTIAVTPMRATGTYTFSYDGDDETFDVTEADEAQDTSAQTNYVTYTLQPDINATAGSYTFTFTVASGDEQTVSAEVPFTVSSLDLSTMSDSERAEFIKNNPAPAPEVSGSGLGGSLSGTVKFTMTSKWPVHPRGWLVKFYNGTTFFDWLMSLMRWLVGGEEYSANESALISVLGMIAEEDNAGAIQTDASTDSKSAEYTMEVDDVAAGGLANGTDYGVKPAIIPAAYYDYIDGTNVTSEDAASETEDSIGTITGTTGGGGGGSTDEILPGSSGGCDAGFGTLALALAATLFLSKKRS